MQEVRNGHGEKWKTLLSGCAVDVPHIGEIRFIAEEGYGIR